MLVYFEAISACRSSLEATLCFRLLRLSLFLFESVKSHGNIPRRHDLAPSLLRYRKATIIHWNAVSPFSNKLLLSRVRTLQAIRQSVRAMLL
jgi:hypothetical protein